MARNKLPEIEMGFPFGANALLSPDQLPPGTYARGMNVVNRGQVIQCRPGYRSRSCLASGRLQGGTFFKPKVGSPIMVVAIEGRIYISDPPFKEFRQLPDVEFSAQARQVFFKQVEKSVTINEDGSLALVAPRNLLVIQDGGSAPAVVFDGTTAEAQRGEGKIPLGGPMEWVGDRLWVANGASLYASDLGNPTSFTEPLYIATPNFFTLPNEITALTKTPSVKFPQLLAFTSNTTTLFQAGIRDRNLWLVTADFQKDILPKVGCVSPRSVVTHYGFLWWFSAFGLTSLDSAAQSEVSSELPYADAEMNDSKARLSSDLSGVACSTFENYLLVSVPYEDKYNRHTWCLDNTALQKGRQVLPAWSSFWTGTRPVEWITGDIEGVSRSFFLSVDYDGQNRLWEAFIPDRLDDGCPITWWVETRAFNHGLPGVWKEFRYARHFLSELSGTVDLAVFWAGAYRGKYKRILTKRIQASRGTFRSGELIRYDDKIFALKKQSRETRTQDGRSLATSETLSSCGVESPNAEFKDEAYQLLIVGSGPGAVRGQIMYVEPPNNEDDSGSCESDETEENFVRFDGAASEDEEFRDALAELTADIPLFTSVQAATLTQGGLTEVAMGDAESVISQQNADRIAESIARRRAAAALEAALPKIVSMGALANIT